MFTNQERTEMKTLASCINALHADGYTENFMVDEKGLHAADSEKTYGPEEVRVVNFYRFEGDSDPGDNSILYAIQTTDEQKGTLTDAFGTYGDEAVTKFMDQVLEISKNTNPKPKDK